MAMLSTIILTSRHSFFRDISFCKCKQNNALSCAFFFSALYMFQALAYEGLSNVRQKTNQSFASCNFSFHLIQLKYFKITWCQDVKAKATIFCSYN